MKVALEFEATALAIIVLPVPGGPYKRTPWVTLGKLLGTARRVDAQLVVEVRVRQGQLDGLLDLLLLHVQTWGYCGAYPRCLGTTRRSCWSPSSSGCSRRPRSAECPPPSATTCAAPPCSSASAFRGPKSKARGPEIKDYWPRVPRVGQNKRIPKVPCRWFRSWC